MAAAYNTILIPVDFSINTETAIFKSVEVANCEGALIYLLHVLPVSCIAKDALMNERKVSLQVLKQKIEKMAHIRVECLIAFSDSVQEVIASKAEEIKADLVVIGKKSNHWLYFLNTVAPDQLAVVVGKPVLTVKPGAARTSMKTIVVPVSNEVPYEKMNAVAALCHNLKLKVHLVTFVESPSDPNDASASSLLHVYQWLKNLMVCQIDYAVLKGSNRIKSILNYAEDIDADLLLLYPGSEIKTGWLKRPLPDVLPASSKLQVLAVEPTKYLKSNHN